MSRKINILFQSNVNCINIQYWENELFAEVAFWYLEKVNRNLENVKFLFNSRKLKPESGKTLEEYNLRNMSRIDIISIDNYNFIEEDDAGSKIQLYFRKKKFTFFILTYSKRYLAIL